MKKQPHETTTPATRECRSEMRIPLGYLPAEVKKNERRRNGIDNQRMPYSNSCRRQVSNALREQTLLGYRQFEVQLSAYGIGCQLGRL